jgi:hypothetical protein
MEHDSKIKTNLEKDVTDQHSNLVHDDSFVLQSVRLRHSSVLADSSNWEFVASEFRFVLYSGAILWLIYLLSQTI